MERNPEKIAKTWKFNNKTVRVTAPKIGSVCQATGGKQIEGFTLFRNKTNTSFLHEAKIRLNLGTVGQELFADCPKFQFMDCHDIFAKCDLNWPKSDSFIYFLTN